MPRNTGTFFKVTVLIYSVIWQYDLRYSFLSPAFTSPLCLCRSSFRFSSPYSIWAVFPTISRDWDCLKGKEQKIWKGERKTVATRLKEKLYRGENLCRAWGVGRSMRTFGWNCHSPIFVVKPSFWVVVVGSITAPLAFDLFPPLAHSWNQPCSQARYLWSALVTSSKPEGFNFWSTLKGASVS